MGTVYFAKWILLPSGEILNNGAIAVCNNLITSVGSRSKVRRSINDRIVNLGASLLLPGFINMHTHLEESVVRGINKRPDETFASYNTKKNTRIKQTPVDTILSSIRLEIRELIAQGITTIVDSSRFGLSQQILKEESIRACIIHELHPDNSVPEENYIRKKLEKTGICNKNIVQGWGPYSLYSLTPQSQRSLIHHLHNRNQLWAAHIAESSEELQAFSERTGDLYFHITRKKEWPFDTCTGPVNYALSENLIPENGICFHCNYITGHELKKLADKNISIVLCYQYTKQMGHKPFPLEVALNRNVSLCLGTEGVAAPGFMSLFDELFAIKNSYPHIPAKQMINWVTQNAANAINAGHLLGSLSEGKFADMMAVRFSHNPHEDILEELIISDPEMIMVMVDGEEVIVNY
ncbi:MAG TPA: amidohydrolase family protein [Chitinispirillaceae bacterium]|nr:amidohydrolase family protein [Chitinispirillaceae bacterium]